MFQHALSSISFIPIRFLNNLYPPDGEMLPENKAHGLELLHVRLLSCAWTEESFAECSAMWCTFVVQKSPSLMFITFVYYGKPVRCTGPARSVRSIRFFHHSTLLLIFHCQWWVKMSNSLQQQQLKKAANLSIFFMLFWCPLSLPSTKTWSISVASAISKMCVVRLLYARDDAVKEESK